MPSLPSQNDLRTGLSNLAADFAQRFSRVTVSQRPLSEFLNLAITRGATFEERGRGFQDAVILCSVLDDMKANGFTTAVMISNDKAFQSDGTARLIRDSGVELKVIGTLDALEQFLRQYLNAIWREHLEQERKQASSSTRRWAGSGPAPSTSTFAMGR